MSMQGKSEPKYSRRRRIEAVPPTYCSCGETAFLLCSEAPCVLVVDIDDAPILGAFGWSDNRGYARAWDGRRSVKLHRIVVAAKPDDIIDHRNRNRWDNRKANLRKTDLVGNARNKSPVLALRGTPCASRFKGIRRAGSKWQARIFVLGARITLGAFASEEDAARAYDRAARKHYGEFAVLNLPV